MIAPASVPAGAAFQQSSPVYSITGPATAKFYVNPDGTAAQSLTHYWKLRQDGVAITPRLATWSISTVSGTVSMTISIGGAVSYQAMTTPTARVRVQAVYLGQTHEGFTDLTASGLATPPPPATQTCPDGSVIPATDVCPTPPPPPPPPPTQTCPDGSVIPATQTCPPPPTGTTPVYSITGPATAKFYVNADGTAAQSLTHYWKLRKDGVAITPSLAAWSVSAVSGTVTMVVSKGGAVSYQTMKTPTARVRVQAVYLGQTHQGFTDLTAYGLSPSPPPPPPPTQTCPDGSVIPATETCPSPPPPDPDPTPTGSTFFAAFGDMSPYSGGKAVANLTRAQGAEHLLMLGDNCYGTTPIATQIDTNYSAEHKAGKIWPVVGNHDYDDACGGIAASAYYTYFVLPNNERYYDVVKGPVHLFAINSYKEVDGLTPTSVQGQWLQQKLATSKAPWKVVFFHHAPYSSGSSKGTATMRWPFEAWGADLVLSGHDHVYERVMLDNDSNGTKIPYIISGLGGKSLSTFGTPTTGSVTRYNGAYGALFVRATSTEMKLEFRNVSNAVIDSLTLSKPAASSQSDAFEFRTVP